MLQMLHSAQVRCAHATSPGGQPPTGPVAQARQPRQSAVVKEVRENLRLTAQLTGQLKGDGATVNVGIGILSSPEWGRIASVLTEALSDEPQAREKVTLALARIASPEKQGEKQG
jgi:hypothetical protein